MSPQNILLWHTDYVQQKALEKQQCREELSLNSPYLPKDRASKRSSVLTSPFQEFHHPGKTDSSQERKREVYNIARQT